MGFPAISYAYTNDGVTYISRCQFNNHFNDGKPHNTTTRQVCKDVKLRLDVQDDDERKTRVQNWH